MKKILSLILVSIILITPIFAINEENYEQGKFKDLEKNDWYYDSVIKMAEHGIISGYDDGTFRPIGNVKRNEFAKLLVSTLSLDINKPNDPTFEDVDLNNWAYPFVESSKYYFTGYQMNGEYYFKPKLDTQREDIFVSLVKGLDYELINNPNEILSKFEDSNKISENLKPYVATALSKGIVSGYEENGKKYIRPTRSINRAETAHLLLTIINKEKIVFDEEKVTFEEEPKEIIEESNSELNVEISEKQDGFYITWDTVDNARGYKVVASDKPIENLNYRDYGSIEYTEKTETYLYVGRKNNNGNFYLFEPGKTYYFNINIYSKEGIATPTKTHKITMPSNLKTETSVEDFELKYDLKVDGIALEWTPISNAQGYKVVASEEPKESIEYPYDGNFKYTEDTKAFIYFGQKYNQGDFYQFERNRDYYFNINAYYSDGSARPTKTIKISTYK